MTSAVDDLLALLARGHGAFDEPGLDVLAHSLQCAAILADEHPGDPQLIAAGLLHDISDAATPDDHDDHAGRGAAIVEPALGPRVARLVRAHVLAKRYLVATDPSYRARLSARSVETLALQGDALDAVAIAAFDADPDRDATLALRRADERAKVPGAVTPGLESWRPLLDGLTR